MTDPHAFVEPAPEGLTWTSMFLVTKAYECESEKHEGRGIPATHVEWLWIPEQKSIWRHWNACTGCDQEMMASWWAALAEDGQ